MAYYQNGAYYQNYYAAQHTQGVQHYHVPQGSYIQAGTTYIPQEAVNQLALQVPVQHGTPQQRPHWHKDHDGLFRNNAYGPNVVRGTPTQLSAYPMNPNWLYLAQDRNGQVPKYGPGSEQYWDPGPFRMITAPGQSVQGVTYHHGSGFRSAPIVRQYDAGSVTASNFRR